MPSQKNIDQLAQVKEKLASAQNLVIANYSGLDSATQTELRAKIKAAGGEFAVTKNRLVALALKDRLKTDLPAELSEALSGPNAAIYGFSDPVAATKTLVDFAKDHESMEIKVGFMIGQEGAADQVLTPKQVVNLDKLPGKLELRGQLVGTLNAPIYGYVNVLAGTLRKVLYALNAIKTSKSADN